MSDDVNSLNSNRNTNPDEDIDFDWEIYEMGSVEYTDDVRKKLEKDYENALSTIDSEQVLDGSVVSITDREVIVNINYKSDGIISEMNSGIMKNLKSMILLRFLLRKKKIKRDS